jgi:hypothetical protein
MDREWATHLDLRDQLAQDQVITIIPNQVVVQRTACKDGPQTKKRISDL